MTHDQYHLLIGGSCFCLLYQHVGACGPGAPSCGWAWALSRNNFFCEASQENSQYTRARMFRAEGIRMPGSKEASFFRRFYRIPCESFSPFDWERGLVYYGLLENCGATAFLLLCQLSHARTILRQILQRIISSYRYHSYIQKCALAFLVNFVSRVPLGPTTRLCILYVVSVI